MEDDKVKLLADHGDERNSRSIQVQDTDHSSGDVGSGPVPDDPSDVHVNGPNSNQASINPTSDPENGDDEEEKKSKPLTLNQKLTFAGIASMYLTSMMSFSVLAPFFPNEAEKKGVTPAETGLVFGIFALVSFISSPFWGKYLPVIGAKFMYLSGCFVAAGCNLLFGFLVDIESKTTFLAYCFAIRVVESLGSAATITAGMAIVANVFPDNIAQMSGMLELFSGLGFACGPPLGSLFYGIGGYKLPFIVLGCTAMVISIIDIFILPSLKSDNKKEESGSVLAVLKIPAVSIVLAACMWGSACLGFSDPTLSIHLTSPPLNVHPSMVGVLFLLIGGTYGLFAPFWGYIADKKRVTRFMMVIGFYITGISFMLIGPSPLFNVEGKLWIIILSLALLGFSIGIGLMPAFLDLLISAKWYGLPDNLSTQAILSGLFNGAFSLGTFVGPTVGGALVNQMGFDWSSTIFAGGCFVVVIVLSLFGVWEYQCGKGRRKPKHMRSEPYPSIVEDANRVVTA
ncbi:MFS-type transporter SLC18B1-like isoform X2 [Lytechinus pictus]|uniref:MFS-type transporter SLC18B1-like isoform X2 n=1 Tax=Lytechinus pictus TaxID=7653 RepID=UPI0030B9BBDA